MLCPVLLHVPLVLETDCVRVFAVGSLVNSTLITCTTPEWTDVESEFYRNDLEGRALVEIVSKRYPTASNFRAHLAKLLAVNRSACHEHNGIWCDQCWSTCIANGNESTMLNCVHHKCSLPANQSYSDTTKVSSSLGVLYRFYSINKAPDFLGSNLGIASRDSYQSEPTVISNWTRKIWKGRLDNDKDASDEQKQLITFVVHARVPNFFEVQT